MTNPLRNRRAALLLSLLGGACAAGPDYHAPEIASPEGFGTDGGPGVSSSPADLTLWWTRFGDERLRSLVERAAAGSLDLRVAAERIREARALRGAAEADLWPQVGAFGSYSRRRFSENSFAVPGGGGAFGAEDTDLYQLGFDASWEIDLFGRRRRAVEATTAELQAIEEDADAVLVTLVAEVARAYVELRGTQRQLDVTARNLESQEATLGLLRVRRDAGFSSDLDVARSEALAETTRAQLPPLEAAERQSMHRIAVLLGLAPGSLVAELTPPAPIPVPPPEIALGLPAELLRRRPDLRRAERELAAANARIGVAVAERYPRFTLLGAASLQSLEAQTLFESASFAYSYGPRVDWPIFQGGRIDANVAAATSRERQAMTRLEAAFLGAVEETENALVAYVREQSRRRSLASAVDANRRAVGHADALYREGLVDFLNVLEAQRSVLAAEGDLARSETAVSLDAVALFKALGGPEIVPPAAAAIVTGP